jgi:hypothetical protein
LLDEFDVIESVDHGIVAANSFGYASRHLVLRVGEERSSLSEWRRFASVKCEIQVRTILQHAWASISHTLDYKSDEDVPAQVRRKLFQVAALIEVGDQLFLAFRDELDGVRSQYAQRRNEGAWRGLPVDLDSLETAWPSWTIDVARLTVAGSVSVEGRGGNETAFAGRDFEERKVYLADIPDLAEATDVETLGDLRDAINREEIAALVDGHIANSVSYGMANHNASGNHYFTRGYLSLVALFLIAQERIGKVPQGYGQSVAERVTRIS